MSTAKLHRRIDITPLTNETCGLVYFTSTLRKRSKNPSKSGARLTTAERFKIRENSKRYRYYQLSPRTPVYGERYRAIKRRLNFDENNVERNDETTQFDIPKIVISNTESEDAVNRYKNIAKDYVHLTNRGTECVVSPNMQKLIDKLSPIKQYKVLGRGRFGCVIEATYKEKKVAIKIIRGRKSKHKNTLLNEQNGIGLKHPNIININAIARTKQASNYRHNIVVMNSYSNANTLQALLDNDSFQITLRRIISYTVDLCNALQYLHSMHILHLDVKPKNILVLPCGLCKLCDFGSSIKIGEFINETDVIHQVNGTVQYCSPELLIGQNATTASDVYSLGITMWQIIHRSPPYGNTFSEQTLIYLVVKTSLRPKIMQALISSQWLLDYKKLYVDCWHQKPEMRLTLKCILAQLENIYLSEISKAKSCLSFNY